MSQKISQMFQKFIKNPKICWKSKIPQISEFGFFYFVLPANIVCQHLSVYIYLSLHVIKT